LVRATPSLIMQVEFNVRRQRLTHAIAFGLREPGIVMLAGSSFPAMDTPMPRLDSVLNLLLFCFEPSTIRARIKKRVVNDLRARTNFVRRFKPVRVVRSCVEKISLSFFPKLWSTSPYPDSVRGAAASSRTRGGMRWTRMMSRDERHSFADGKVVWSWRP